MIRAAALLLALASAPGCVSAPRFVDRPIVWRVNDMRNISQPDEREFLVGTYGADIIVMRRLTRMLELRDDEPAWNTNALDEVPSSSWFNGRIGVRAVSPEEAARGPVTAGPPELPLVVVGGKGGGANPGFIARDATGRRFIVKFDTKNNPEMQTATGAVVNRLFWTLGYNVPSDTVFVFHRDQLSVGDGATYEDELQRDQPVTTAWLDDVLRHSPRRADGRYRASASEFLDGIPVGGFAAEGTRSDDANDVIPHEHRRELRALRVFSAWLGHTDMKEDNSLDMYVEEGGRHFLRHYLLDFGEALGSHQAEKRRLEDGFEHVLDWRYSSLALLSLGLWERPWERQEETPWLAVGAFGAEHFEPALWREAYPYWPFWEAEAADLYWGAKLVLRFDRAILEAVVAEGHLGDPEAAAYLVDTLLERRRRIGREWLEAVTPLDYFEIRDGALCGVDVGVQTGVARLGVVERLPELFRPEFDDADVQDGVLEQRVGDDGSFCLPIEPGNHYRIARLRTRRGHARRPIMQVHYKGGARPRILGIIRVER